MRPIDADALRSEVYRTILEVADSPMPNDYASKLATKMGEMFQKLIDEASTVDAEPVRHGKWMRGEIDTLRKTKYYCSECGGWMYFRNGGRSGLWTHYCPNCGAKMDAEEES